MIIPFLIYFLLEDLVKYLVKRYKESRLISVRPAEKEREYLRSA